MSQQPTWIQPQTKTDGSVKPVLKLYNSLTRSKVPFVPMNENEVTWYSCGPTVYDASHMGHARNYVTIDINRRILQDYFGYNVKFIQNVTDIDDKIILKARHEYLFSKFSEEILNSNEINNELISKAKIGWNLYVSKNLPKFFELENQNQNFNNWVNSLDLSKEIEINPKIPMYLKASKLALEAIENPISYSVKDFLEKIKDIIVPLLDKELGSTVTDPEIFKKTSSYWELKFDQDMSRLNVLQPTVTTRVSEYIPEIIQYVVNIIKAGFAYSTSDGSVYFNTSKFDASSNHDYAKLQPWNKSDLTLLEEGEGSLTSSDFRQSPADFALWKSSKPGEPFWDSPWGKGRPGWHIECSVMASDFTGSQMDIHSGGIDLAFPHHDNELAQSEAHFDCKQWVNYFLHTGHLHIEGQKMSKSLKNFITIEESLTKYTSRQLRLCFSLVQWNNQLDFKESLLNEVKSIESTFSKFFNKVRALNTDYKHNVESGIIISKKLSEYEKNLLKNLLKIQVQVHESFCDNLATPQVIRLLLELVQITNMYITNSQSNSLRIDPILQITYYITKILNILGFESRNDKLGWSEAEAESIKSSREEIAMPFVKILSQFRDLVRSAAIAKEDYSVFLEATDSLRNKDLLDLGVMLDDRQDSSALIKFLTDQEKQELISQQQLKIKEAKEKEKLEKAKLSPLEMFKTEEYKKQFREWDNEGLPTVDINGEEVTKSMKKKLKKLYDAQKKLHEEYLQNNQK
ncbi:hypothetical protein PACTADRAFT_49952 [Pachysolen tannophilus NRRL Y-2460]|uniref:cysteine--tRNA ligase n=1 Tax=Pachysolen tannophilus NRRL Y-2460 TaxID=669874 RepID=A0A1E4TTX5_PACTA|nr:hypothetical protein PACTADRAFT_49952 [Pachysolen tannophilus NRRL Y-2460]